MTRHRGVDGRSSSARAVRPTAIACRAGRAVMTAVALSACNGQFDFDATPRDDGGAAMGRPDAGPFVDAPTDVPSDDAPKTGIACGNESCSLPGCCSSAQSFACVDVAKGATCGGTLIQCDDTTDCPAGQVCCAEGLSMTRDESNRRGAFAAGRVHCETEAHCRSSNFVILCDPDRPSPCAQCIASTLAALPAGYHQCAP